MRNISTSRSGRVSGQWDAGAMQVALLRASREAREAAAEALHKSGEHILKESNKLVPVDTGKLKRSGRVVVNEQDLTVGVGYDTPYAARQHEDMTLNHPNGGEAKFLEKAMHSEARRCREIIRDEFIKQLGMK